MGRADVDEKAVPVSRTEFSGANGDKENFVSLVGLTMSNNGNHTRLMPSLL